MAKSLLTIHMNYMKMMQQADKLDEAAAYLRKAANKSLGDGLNELSAVWRSDTASAFLAKGDKIYENLLQEAKEVTREADALRTIAKNTYEAEKRAYELAKIRNH